MSSIPAHSLNPTVYCHGSLSMEETVKLHVPLCEDVIKLLALDQQIMRFSAKSIIVLERDGERGLVISFTISTTASLSH